LGLKEVPVIIREASEQKKLELALIENVQRQDLDLIETARAYRRLMDEFNLTQEETAKKAGKARSTVANTLRLLDLPEEIQRALSSGRITGHDHLCCLVHTVQARTTYHVHGNCGNFNGKSCLDRSLTCYVLSLTCLDYTSHIYLVNCFGSNACSLQSLLDHDSAQLRCRSCA
jgi:predicted DNA-binding protein (UPF0251 family)